MLRRTVHITALIGCALFLAGNIMYDQLGTDENPPDYRIFYIPQSLMIFTLILLAREYSKLQGKWIQVLWWLFFWLSVGQLIKFCLFNPFLQNINDYVYLALLVIFVVHQLIKKK